MFNRIRNVSSSGVGRRETFNFKGSWSTYDKGKDDYGYYEKEDSDSTFSTWRSW